MPPADESAASAPAPPSGSGQDRRATQPTLHTARLTLVPLTGEHLELEVELDSDAEVMRYLTGRAVSRAEVERAHQRRIAAARPVPGLGLSVRRSCRSPVAVGGSAMSSGQVTATAPTVRPGIRARRCHVLADRRPYP